MAPQETAWKMLSYHFHKTRGAALIGDYGSAADTLRHCVLPELAAAVSALDGDPILFDALVEVTLSLDGMVAVANGVTEGVRYKKTSEANLPALDACVAILRADVSLAAVRDLVRILRDGAPIVQVLYEPAD